jgi:hypothetical protein
VARSVLNVETTRKRRGLRRFLFVALIAITPALAQQPVPAVQPVVDMLVASEAELAAALRANDLERMQRLAWRSHEAAFALVKTDPPIVAGDPVREALRSAHIACANAHSTVGMLASVAVSVLLSNSGGSNTKVDNDSDREQFDFFLKPYGAQRARCAERSGLRLPPASIAGDAAGLFAAFSPVKTPRLTPEDRQSLATLFAGLATVEQAVPTAIASNDAERIKSALVSVSAMRRFLAVRNDPDMPRRDFAVTKECAWAAGHAGQLLAEIHEGLIRPDIRAAQLDEARKTLGQFQDTKADCARALGLPREAGFVRGLTEADFAK